MDLRKGYRAAKEKVKSKSGDVLSDIGGGAEGVIEDIESGELDDYGGDLQSGSGLDPVSSDDDDYVRGEDTVADLDRDLTRGRRRRMDDDDDDLGIDLSDLD